MKKIITILIISLFFLYSCEDGNSIIDSTGNHISTYGELHTDTLYAINDTFLIGNKATTGYSTKVFLGRHNNAESRFLLKFNTLPADSITVDSLYLLLESVSHYGNPAADFEMQIKRVTSSWDLSVNKDKSWSFQDNVSNDAATTTVYTVTTEDSQFYKIELPDTLVSIWRDTTDGGQNFGLAVDFENAGYIKEFKSQYSTIKPRLVYVYQNSTNDSTIRDTVNATVGASIVDFTGELSSDSLMYVTSGYIHHAFVEFNFSSIKGLDSSIISSVNFIFKKDQSESYKNKSASNIFYFRTVTTPFYELPQFKVDSTFSLSSYYNISLSENEDDQFEIDSYYRGIAGQYYIQSIINGTVDYGSFMLQFVGEGNAISQYALKGTGSLKVADKPKMIIKYYKIPKSRL